MARQKLPVFYQATCSKCSGYAVIAEGSKSYSCTTCGSSYKTPSASSLKRSDEIVVIPDERMKLSDKTLENLEELYIDIVSSKDDRRLSNQGYDDSLQPYRIENQPVVSKLMEELLDDNELEAEDEEFLYSSLKVDWLAETSPQIAIPGVGTELHLVFDYGGMSHLLVLGAQPALLFSGNSGVAKILDFILEVFELFILVAFAIKPGLKRIGKHFGKLVEKIAESPRYKRLIKAIVEAVKSKNVRRVLDKVKEFIEAIARNSDFYNELKNAVKLVLKGYLTAFNIIWTLMKWFARGATGGSAIALEVVGWLIGVAIKVRNM